MIQYIFFPVSSRGRTTKLRMMILYFLRRDKRYQMCYRNGISPIYSPFGDKFLHLPAPLGLCLNTLRRKHGERRWYQEALPFVGWRAGGGRVWSHVTCLNFKASRVGVYKCFTSLSEIERKFFVFVRILDKEDSDAL